MPEDTEIKNPRKSTEVSLDEIEFETPKGKYTYDWESIKSAIESDKAFILPPEAKRNSVETGLTRLKIKAKVAFLKANNQLVVIPR